METIVICTLSLLGAEIATGVADRSTMGCQTFLTMIRHSNLPFYPKPHGQDFERCGYHTMDDVLYIDDNCFIQVAEP